MAEGRAGKASSADDTCDTAGKLVEAAGCGSKAERPPQGWLSAKEGSSASAASSSPPNRDIASGALLHVHARLR